MGYTEEKIETNIDHVYDRKIKLKSEIWRIFWTSPAVALSHTCWWEVKVKTETILDQGYCQY